MSVVNRKHDDIGSGRLWAGCASTEGVTALSGAWGPPEFPLYTFQCVFLFWEPRRNVGRTDL